MEQLDSEANVADMRWWLCRLCLSVSSAENTRRWIRPCLCRHLVHRQCLLVHYWAMEIQNCSVTPSCSVCRVPYRVEPKKGRVLSTLEKLTYRLYPYLQEVTCDLSSYIAVDVIITTFGLIMLDAIHGEHGLEVMLLSMDTMNAVSLCQSIPLAGVIINYVSLEDYLLNFLHRCSSLPVLGKVMPWADPKNPRVIPKYRSVGVVVGGLLLPFWAKTTGNLFLRWEPSNSKRFIVGGLFFLVTRGLLYMYYTQKNYVRQNNLSVTNYTAAEN